MRVETYSTEQYRCVGDLCALTCCSKNAWLRIRFPILSSIFLFNSLMSTLLFLATQQQVTMYEWRREFTFYCWIGIYYLYIYIYIGSIDGRWKWEFDFDGTLFSYFPINAIPPFDTIPFYFPLSSSLSFLLFLFLSCPLYFVFDDKTYHSPT